METIEGILTDIALDHGKARNYLNNSVFNPSLSLYELKGDGYAVRGKTRQALVGNLIIMARLLEDQRGGQMIV
ncbi:hypothetical protein [Dyadobacter sp. BHUBP1]|uniref:hypothetical protein n=1 Tax=Dyadobacter sp. BHUBP1 TaxID=3424178 RepID=UPI003D344CA1